MQTEVETGVSPREPAVGSLQSLNFGAYSLAELAELINWANSAEFKSPDLKPWACIESEPADAGTSAPAPSKSAAAGAESGKPEPDHDRSIEAAAQAGPALGEPGSDASDASEEGGEADEPADQDAAAPRGERELEAEESEGISEAPHGGASAEHAEPDTRGEAETSEPETVRQGSAAETTPPQKGSVSATGPERGASDAPHDEGQVGASTTGPRPSGGAAASSGEGAPGFTDAPPTITDARTERKPTRGTISRGSGNLDRSIRSLARKRPHPMTAKRDTEGDELSAYLRELESLVLDLNLQIAQREAGDGTVDQLEWLSQRVIDLSLENRALHEELQQVRAAE